MATGTDNNGIYIYRLTFSQTITKPSGNLTQLCLEQGVRREFSDGNASYYLLLQGVKVNRKIYQPIEIEAELMIMDKTTNTSGEVGMKAPSFQDVSALLLERQVAVDVLKVDRIPDTTRTLEYQDQYNIAKNCYVYELNPQLKHEVNGTKMYVKINIFSMDKLMTLNKYSKAYVARKLGSGILAPESLEFGTFKKDVPLVQTSYDEQKFLQYEENKTMYEFIQPYLVQYNESFYDFMVRTSNRCGEFLYFENGKLTLGLPQENFKEDAYEETTIDSTNNTQTTKKVSLKIKDYETVTMQDISADPLNITPFARDSVKDGEGDITNLNQTVIKKNDAGFPKEIFPQQTSSNSEVATDEYIFPLLKDYFSSIPREMFYYGDGNDIAMFQALKAGKALFSNKLDAVAGLLASTIGVGMIVDHGVQSFLSRNQRNAVNAAKNALYVDPFEGKKEQRNPGEEFNKVVPFASYVSAGWTKLDYYNDIFKNEEAQQRKIICINMGTNFVDVKLGQKITVEGLSDNYVVIQVQQISEEAWSRDYEKYDSQGSDKYTGKRSQKIYAIPAYKNEKGNETFIPPVQPVPVIRKVGPQTAFVTANEDPKFQGRVRIAYPWQSEKSGMKTTVAEAAQKLKAIEDEMKKKTAEKDEALNLMTTLDNDIKKLKKYVNATDEERELMLGESESLKKELEKLKGERSQLITDLETLKQAEPKDDAKISLKETLFEEKENEIKEKEAKKEHADQLEPDMKAAAQEHDRKTGRDSKSAKDPNYTDVEKHNTIICKYKNAYEAQRQKYRELSSEIARADKEKTVAADNSRKAVTALQQKIIEMSTPWVRVATPMATPGGGSFYRPRVGDEVLVNYDCDNVERPYVVGSFFSKNTLTPDERYYRKQSPEVQWKDVSMAISSPNGHHISFTDPENGGSFITNLISPGLGFYGGVLGFNNFAKGGKDLAGGIHIGDRYGIYEMEMLSHKRQINIKSPFGTVNINAFTGITISAPNGDVTITGKNITLEAGNKVTINSGTNLPQPGFGEQPRTKTKVADIAKAIVDGVAGVLMDLFVTSIVDLSTIRHIIEVFVRPVDGTTLIKSRKFLRLEAGLGNATIKRDQYKDVSKGKMAVEQMFFLALIDRVKFLNNGIKLFFEKYNTKRDKFFDTFSPYYDKMAAASFTDKKSMSEIVVEKAKENANANKDDYEFTRDEFNRLVRDNMSAVVEFEGREYRYDDEKYEFIKPVFMAHYKSAYDLYKFCSKNDIEALFEYVPAEGDTFEWLTKAMKDTVTEKLTSDTTLGDWKSSLEEDMRYASVYENRSDPFRRSQQAFFRRAQLLIFLKKVYDAPENKKEVDNSTKLGKLTGWWDKKRDNMYKYFYIGYDVAKVTDPHVVDLGVDYWWKRQVHVIDRWNQNSFLRILWDNGVEKLIGAVYDNTVGMWKKETDRQVWNGDLNGQILFSDQEESTLSFKGEGLHKETNANQGNIKHLKWILRDM